MTLWISVTGHQLRKHIISDVVLPIHRLGLMHKPFISVISITYQRKEFINQAITSALEQTLSREFYEIILVTDVDVDEQLIAKGNVIVLHSSERDVGAKVAMALDSCAGEVICLLEDDDLWERNKLETVFAEFTANSSLGFYHNGWAVIDVEGRPVSHPVHSTGRRIMARIGGVTATGRSLSYAGVRRLVRLNADFNGSSISLRKSILAERVEYLRRIRLNYDPFLFYSAIVSGYLIKVDSLILTRYRVHKKNYSRNLGNTGPSPDYSDFYVIRDMLEHEKGSESSLKSLDCSISDLSIENYWVLGIRNRPSLVGSVIRHLRYFTPWEIEYNSLLIGFTLLYLIFPQIGRFVYMSHYSGDGG